MSNTRKCKIMDVTPELAMRWLEKNTHNRPIRHTLVETYALTMKRGEWRLTPEPIAFCKPFVDPATLQKKPETLIEGQHRLWAVIESGVTCKFTVWFGCEPEEFTVIGQGSERTNGDILAVTRKDLKDPTLTASVITAFIRHGLGQNNSVEAWMVRKVLEHMGDEVQAVVEAKKMLKKRCNRQLLASLCLAHLCNPSMAGLITRQMFDAVGFTEHDPIRAVYLYLQSQLSATAQRDTSDVQFYKISHGISARMQGRSLKVLRITTEGVKWLREAGQPRLDPLVKSLFGRTPGNFYTPQMTVLTEEKETT